MTPDSPTSTHRFDAIPYQPDGGVPFGGLLLTTALTFGAAIVIGAVVSIIHQWLYLVLLFPMLMGLGVGIAGVGGIKLGKVRNTMVAGLIGLTAGALVMLASYYGDYLQKLQAGWRGRGGNDSFAQFIDERAELGVTIGRVGRGNDKGMNLGYYGSYIYWLVEIGIAAGIAFYLMKKSTSEPFCSSCHSWKQGQVLGGLNVGRETVKEIVNQGDLLKLLAPDLPAGSPVVFMAHLCPQCGEQGTLEVTLKEITRNRKGERKEIELGTWSFAGEALPAWKGVFAPPEPAPSPETPT